MLFGMQKVGPGLHFVSTCAVAVGTLISSTWILASNSWMHTPQGHQIIDGRVVPVDWLAVIFNPSFPYRLTHTVLAAFMATALFVGASAAWHLLRGRDQPAVRKMLSMALWMLLAVAPLQALVGDMHGLNTLKHQPAKLAAMEGHWENHPGEGVPLILFGWPDMEAETTRWKIEIPRAGSLLLTHTWDGTIPALKDFKREDRPNSTIVFWTFRVMVGIGFTTILLALVGLLLRRGARLYSHRGFLRCHAGDGTDGAGRATGGLVHHRDRPPAVDHLRADAYGRCGVTGLGGAARHRAWLSSSSSTFSSSALARVIC